MKRDRPWLKLDNAGKIYPAVSTHKWSALFRVSMTLDEPVCPETLQAALLRVSCCLPFFFMRLRHGVFWYYLEAADVQPRVREDGPFPCMPFTQEDQGFCFRVLYYRSRIAVEFFHVLTDGSGGLQFLKTLVAQYLALRYNTAIPAKQGVIDCAAPPDPEWSEDGFLRYAGAVTQSRSERDAYRVTGTPEADGFVHLTCGVMPASLVAQLAKEKRVSVTTYLTAVMLLALYDLQRADRVPKRRQRPLKVSVPVNLRRFFPTGTLRNFSSYINPEIDPRMGEHSFDEVLHHVHHFLNLHATKKQLGAKFTTNVRSERNAAVRSIPLFLKNPVLKFVYSRVGDRKTSTTITNLGPVELPAEMSARVRRVEVILGPLKRNPAACAIATWGDELYFNITRTIREPRLERAFFTRLIKLGVPVKVEANRKGV